MRRRGAQLAALVACGSAGVFVAGALADPPTPCRSVEQALREGRLADAQAEYVRLLSRSPDEVCATAGLRTVLELRAPRAAETVDPFAAALALKKAGYDEAARTEAEKVILANPTVSVRDVLKVKRSVPETIGVWLGWVIGTLAALLLVIALVRGGRRWLLGAAPVKVDDLGDADAASANAGKQVAAAVREALQRLAKDSGSRLDMVQKFSDPITIPAEVSTAVPQAKVLAALLPLVQRFSFFSRRLTVNGQLGTADDGRAVATIALTLASGQIVEQVTMRDRATEGPPGAHFSRLAIPIAVWLMYALRRHAGDWPVEPPWPGRNDQGPPPLGTESWESFAIFSLGANVHEQGDVDGAVRFYVAALNKDPGNRGAEFNLAVLESGGLGRNGPTRMDLVRSRERLAALRAAVDARDPLWYRVVYMQAAQTANVLLRETEDLPDPDEPLVAEAEDLARLLVRTIVARLGDPETGSELKRFLAEIERPALILLAGIRALRTSGPPLTATSADLAGQVEDLSCESLIDRANQDGRLPPRAQYNLACCYTTLAQKAVGGLRDARADLAMKHLGYALESRDRGLRRHAASDPSLRFLKNFGGTADAFWKLTNGGV